LRWITVRLVV